jgi:hypothetical protein
MFKGNFFMRCDATRNIRAKSLIIILILLLFYAQISLFLGILTNHLS